MLLDRARGKSMSASIKVPHSVREMHPRVQLHFINRNPGLRKPGVCKGADRNDHHARNGIQPIKSGRAASRTKVKPGGSALVADAHILLAPALDGHRISRESGLSAKHANGALFGRPGNDRRRRESARLVLTASFPQLHEARRSAMNSPWS